MQPNEIEYIKMPVAGRKVFEPLWRVPATVVIEFYQNKELSVPVRSVPLFA